MVSNWTARNTCCKHQDGQQSCMVMVKFGSFHSTHRVKWDVFYWWNYMATTNHGVSGNVLDPSHSKRCSFCCRWRSINPLDLFSTSGCHHLTRRSVLVMRTYIQKALWRREVCCNSRRFGWDAKRWAPDGLTWSEHSVSQSVGWTGSGVAGNKITFVARRSIWYSTVQWHHRHRW